MIVKKQVLIQYLEMKRSILKETFFYTIIGKENGGLV
jgi:hypothetical protein